MRRKKIIVLALTCAIFLGMLTGCSQGKEVRKSSEYGDREQSAEDADWTRVETDTVDLQNERLHLSMDAATGHFVLQDSSWERESRP